MTCRRHLLEALLPEQNIKGAIYISGKEISSDWWPAMFSRRDQGKKGLSVKVEGQFFPVLWDPAQVVCMLRKACIERTHSICLDDCMALYGQHTMHVTIKPPEAHLSRRCVTHTIFCSRLAELNAEQTAQRC